MGEDCGQESCSGQENTRNAYTVLGVHMLATEDEIKRAWREAAKVRSRAFGLGVVLAQRPGPSAASAPFAVPSGDAGDLWRGLGPLHCACGKPLARRDRPCTPRQPRLVGQHCSRPGVGSAFVLT